MHLNAVDAITFTGFAATAFNIKTKAAGLITTRLSLRRLGKKLSHHIKSARISGRVRARCAPNRRLIDGNNFIQLFYALDAVELPSPATRTL